MLERVSLSEANQSISNEEEVLLDFSDWTSSPANWRRDLSFELLKSWIPACALFVKELKVKVNDNCSKRGVVQILKKTFRHEIWGELKQRGAKMSLLVFSLLVGRLALMLKKMVMVMLMMLVKMLMMMVMKGSPSGSFGIQPGFWVWLEPPWSSTTTLSVRVGQPSSPRL